MEHSKSCTPPGAPPAPKLFSSLRPDLVEGPWGLPLRPQARETAALVGPRPTIFSSQLPVPPHPAPASPTPAPQLSCIPGGRGSRCQQLRALPEVRLYQGCSACSSLPLSPPGQLCPTAPQPRGVVFLRTACFSRGACRGPHSFIYWSLGMGERCQGCLPAPAHPKQGKDTASKGRGRAGWP